MSRQKQQPASRQKQQPARRPKVTHEQRHAIRERYARGGITYAQLASEHGIAANTIATIIKAGRERVREHVASTTYRDHRIIVPRHAWPAAHAILAAASIVHDAIALTRERAVLIATTAAGERAITRALDDAERLDERAAADRVTADGIPNHGRPSRGPADPLEDAIRREREAIAAGKRPGMT